MPAPLFHVPIFIVNFKAYIWGRKALELAKMVEEVAQETSVYLIVIPQIVDIPFIAKETELPIFSPHMDSLIPGRGTGRILPEAIKESGAVGALFNHSEYRLPLAEISMTIKRAREVGLISIVASSTPEEARTIATSRPDVILSEPPSRIGTLKSVGEDREFVIRSIKNVKSIDPEIIVISGAGVSSGRDVTELVRLGVEGTGASRVICEAKEPRSILTEMVKALEDEWERFLKGDPLD
ncbi:MAG: triose-phosphate isomerase [Candidatus Methylarchaceae archaeon HK02M1]|nr:triose-phosphate isomerase [Candidatus Methylarchaceae archaeon HK02M1]